MEHGIGDLIVNPIILFLIEAQLSMVKARKQGPNQQRNKDFYVDEKH